MTWSTTWGELGWELLHIADGWEHADYPLRKYQYRHMLFRWNAVESTAESTDADGSNGNVRGEGSERRPEAGDWALVLEGHDNSHFDQLVHQPGRYMLVTLANDLAYAERARGQLTVDLIDSASPSSPGAASVGTDPPKL